MWASNPSRTARVEVPAIGEHQLDPRHTIEIGAFRLTVRVVTKFAERAEARWIDAQDHRAAAQTASR